eukprot:4773285-Amphidinium_carterae.3
MWITTPWFGCSRPTRPTNPGPETSAADSTPNNPKPIKGKGIEKGNAKGKGKGDGNGKPKSASAAVAEEETWEDGGEDRYDESGEVWQEEEEQPEAAHAEIEEEVFCAKATMDTKDHWELMVLGFIGCTPHPALSAFIPTGEVKTEMTVQNTGEKYVSRETKYRPGQKADRLGFQWTGVTKFKVTIVRSSDGSVQGSMEVPFQSPIVQGGGSQCYALNESGTTHVLLDRSMLPENAAGAKAVTIKMAPKGHLMVGLSQLKKQYFQRHREDDL